MFYGRELELAELNRRYKLRDSNFVVVYGRRRIGKSFLLDTFKKDKPNLSFEGVENQPTTIQISKFIQDFSIQTKNSLMSKLQIDNWMDALQLLTGRNVKYKLFDPNLNFYFRFVDQHQRLIQQNEKQNLFIRLVEKKWTPWLGIAFEVFCLRNAYLIAEIAGFAADVISMAPYFSAKDEKFQIDLIFTRANNILTVCEIKFYDKPVGTDIIPEVKRKLLLLPKTKKDTIETMLISPFGADKSLRDSDFFNHIIEFDDFLKK